MGQQISNCKSGNEPSSGSFEPITSESRKRRFPGTSPKSLLLLKNKTNTHNDEGTASTGFDSSKASSPPSPLGSSRGATDNNNGKTRTEATNSNSSLIAMQEQLHHPRALRYTTSTRNLQYPTKKAPTTSTTTSIPSTKPNRSLIVSGQQDQLKQDQLHEQIRTVKPFLLRAPTAPTDKRSNPVKFPRKRQTYGSQKNFVCDDSSTHPDAPSHSHENLLDSSYLERMYDSRTWEMYRRITNHREKVEAFNASNTLPKQRHDGNDDDRNCSASQTYMSDPVQRVTNSSTMEGGVDYDNFYDPDVEDDEDSRGAGAAFFLEDHSAPPYRHHRHSDNGQHHHDGACYYQHGGRCEHNNTENYSEWEHMYGDDVETDGDSGNDPTNAHGGNHETIFLFDF